MEWFVVNLVLGKAKRVVRNGKAWWVAPATSLPGNGVLNGSKGALFYPESEVAYNILQWDGQPIVNYHPISVNGEHVSARHPGIADKQQIGHVSDTTYNGKLRHRMWFDEAKTLKVDRRVIENLRRGVPMEVSTGLYTDNEAAPPGAVSPEGKPYSFIARNYKADHIAVLPDQIGACSIQEGCGVGVINQQRQENLPMKNSMTFWHKLGELIGLTANDVNGTDHQSVGGINKTDHRTVAPAGTNHQPRHPTEGKFQGKPANAARLGHADLHGKTDGKGPLKFEKPEAELEEDDAAAEIVGEQPNPDGRNLARIVHTDDDQEAAEAGNPDDHQNPAGPYGPPEHGNKPAANAGFDHGNYLASGSMDPHANSKQAAAMSLHSEHEPAFIKAKDAMSASKEGDGAMAAKHHEGAAKEHEKAALEARKSGKHEDAELHDNAASMHRKTSSMHAATCNQRSSTQSRGTDMTTAEQRKVRLKELRPKMLKHLTANCTCSKEKLAYNDLNDETLAILTVNSGGNFEGLSKDGATAAAQKDEEDEENDGDPNMAKSEKSKVANMRDWEAQMPAEAKAVWNAAKGLERAERRRLVSQLIADVENEEQRKLLWNKLIKKPIGDLQELAMLIPSNNRRQAQDEGEDSMPAQFVGNGGVGAGEIFGNDGFSQPVENFGGTGLNGIHTYKDDADWPVMNFEDEKEARQQTA